VLTYLGIGNLAIIDRIELELLSGLTVITGETGAGKSMLLNGLTLLLGAKMGRDVLRTGEKSLSVEGIWEGPQAAELLTELLDDGPPEPEEIIIRRAVTFAASSRRDRLFVAGRLVPRAAVQEAGPGLVNISSQHEFVSLLRKKEHIQILDRFAGLEPLLEKMGSNFERFIRLNQAVERLQAEAGNRDMRMARLKEVIAELRSAGLEEGEEEELHRRIERLTHAVDISNALVSAVDTLYEKDGALLSSLCSVEATLSSISHFEPDVVPLIDRLNSCVAELDDVVDQLRRVMARSDVEPHLLDHLQERLAAIQKLKRRYGVEQGDQLLSVRAEAESELAQIEETSLSMGELLEAREKARDAMLATAGRLHARRVKIAGKLEAAIRKVLAQLEMKKASFVVEIAHDEMSMSATGADRVEFLLSANPGEDVKPLRKIASGGELSRVLLAFKAVLADAYPVPTYVFDEIDAGIGGKTALAVGKLLAELAEGYQVICITHTAQIAAFADQHLVVTKEDRAEKTRARVAELPTKEARVQELARMLSGLEDSTTALLHAGELLDAARALKGHQ